MKKKILWMTETAVMLALLISLQWVTKAGGQWLTGSCVNGVLTITALMVGLPGGLTVALLSPIFAFMLGIAPNPVTVPVIMIGNSVFVILLHFCCKGKWIQRICGLLTAAIAKFAVLYALVNWVICGVAADALLAQKLLKQPMLLALPASFGFMQLFTALIGGSLALLIVPTLKKVLSRA